MKKFTLIIALFLVCTAVSFGAVPDDTQFSKGLTYYNSGNYKAAAKQLQGYVSRQPDPVAYYLLGYSLYKLGRFSDADEYFSQAYLIDPEFSPEKAGLIKQPSEEIMKKQHAVPKAPAAASETNAKMPMVKQPKPAEKEAQPLRPVQGTPATQREKSAAPTPPTLTPKPSTPSQQVSPAPVTPPSAPAVQPKAMPKQIPGAAAPLLVGIMAAFGMVFFIIAIGLYVYAGLCLFLIAKKLNVPAPWTAWVPLVNIWTLVASAGKPAWWLVLCIIPLVNVFVFIYLYMCVTENLGRDKWLGLLMLLPVVNLIFLGWLAFSKTESPVRPGTV